MSELVVAILGSSALTFLLTRLADRLSPAWSTADRARLQQDIEQLRKAQDAPRDRFAVAHEVIIRSAVARELAGRSSPSSRLLTAMLIGVGAPFACVGSIFAGLAVHGQPDPVVPGATGFALVGVGISLLLGAVLQSSVPASIASSIESMLETNTVEAPSRKEAVVRFFASPSAVKHSDELRQFISSAVGTAHPAPNPLRGPTAGVTLDE